MEKDIPLVIEKFSSIEEDEFLIASPIEIEFVLRNIAENGSRVALYYGGTNYFILTTLLDVNDTGLWLEQSPNSTNNKRIIGSDDLVCVSSHLNIKVQFTAHQASAVEYQGYPAFYLPLPDSIYRVQRRDSFRLAPPLSEPLRCVIPANVLREKRQREMTIMDISAGGMKITCAEDDLDLEEGKTYENCQIKLSDVDTIIVTITVRNLASLTTRSGQILRRAGCKFENLDGVTNILLQRYVNNVQRANTKTRKG